MWSALNQGKADKIAGKKYPVTMIIGQWTKLPRNIVESPSLVLYEKRLGWYLSEMVYSPTRPWATSDL